MVDSQFAEECLKHHNTLRALHNSPELVIDIKLNDFAQEWAVSLASQDLFEHRQENDYGENIYVGSHSDPEWTLGPQIPVQSWYDEISAYKFGEPTPENLDAVGHFTQVVWKASQKLGIGVQKGQSGKVYVVCNYDPPGNVTGQFVENVEPPAQKEGDDGKSIQGSQKTVLPGQASVAGSQRSVPGSQRSVPGSQRSVPDSQRSVPSSQRSVPNSLRSGASSRATIKSAAEFAAKLKDIPPQDVLIWTSWLTKVAETVVDEWDNWLLAHINLAKRMNEELTKAKRELEREEAEASLSQASLQKSKSCDDSISSSKKSIQKSDVATDAPAESTESEEADVAAAASGASKPASAAAASGASKPASVAAGSKMSAAGSKLTAGAQASKSVSRIEKSIASIEPSHKSARSTVSFSPPLDDENEEEEDDEDEEDEGEDEEEEEEVQIIPIPYNEEKMLEMMREFRRRAKRYQLLYEYWLENADKVIEEIINGKFPPPPKVQISAPSALACSTTYTGSTYTASSYAASAITASVITASAITRITETPEEYPYFFYLLQEANIKLDDDDDECDLRRTQDGRESIYCRNLKLFFRLPDECDPLEEETKSVKSKRSKGKSASSIKSGPKYGFGSKFHYKCLV